MSPSNRIDNAAGFALYAKRQIKARPDLSGNNSGYDALIDTDAAGESVLRLSGFAEIRLEGVMCGHAAIMHMVHR